MGGSVGGNKSDSDAGFKQGVWGPQGESLGGLYDQARQLFGSQNFGQLRDTAGELDPYNRQLREQGLESQKQMMGGGAYGDPAQIRSQLMAQMGQQAGGSNMGKMYESIVGGQGNTYIDPMVDAMRRSGGEALATQQAGAGVDAASMGQGGSSRHAMQNAMLGRSAEQDMMDREMAMRGGAYDKDLSMKMGIARQADAGAQQTQRNLMDMLGGSQRSMEAGMGAGQGLQNLGLGAMAPWMQANQAPWDAMSQYANVLGRPTVLGSGQQSGSSKGAGASASIKG